jgi:hypothetical protein
LAVLESGKVEFVRRTLHTYIIFFSFSYGCVLLRMFLVTGAVWGVLIVLDDDQLVQRSVTSHCYCYCY